MSKSYLPDAEDKKIQWIQNFSDKLPTYAAKYGIAAADVTDAKAGAVAYAYWVDYANKQSEYSKKLTSFKIGLGGGTDGTLTIPVVPVVGTAPALPAAGIFKRIASIVTVIKSKPVYATNDGIDLGIEGTKAAPKNLAQVKPVLSLRVTTGGRAEIVWAKDGHDGIEIQIDKGNGTWQFLGIDLKPNYTDNSAMPETGISETRRYRAIYIQDENHIGQWSDVVEIAVKGE